MSTQDPMGSAVPPERPKDPTHFGGEGLYGAQPETAEGAEDSSLKVALGEHVQSATKESLAGDQSAQGSAWEFAKRNHVPALLAVGGIAWLIGALVRRSTGR